MAGKAHDTVDKGGQKKKTAVVIGAGVGGVATAARLAKAGFNVTVLEKNAFTGGRCSLIHHEGHRFDQGPSLLLLPKLFQETFFDLDTSLEAEGVELLKCEPNYNMYFKDGETFKLSSDTAVMKKEIERFEGKAGFTRYLSWLQEAHDHYEISVTEVLHRDFTSILDLVTRWSFLKNVVRLHPFESIWTRASRYFWSERLRRVFTFGSMYMGMSPFEAPGTYSLLQYTELAEGIWYPRGGFHAVVEAIVKLGKGLGVDYRLGCAVERVLTSEDGKRLRGVRLASGEEMSADVVVVNADLVYAYNNLFSSPSSPKQDAGADRKDKAYQTPYAQELTTREGSCSSLSFYWSLSKAVPALTTHNIFLAEAYKESFDSIFKQQNIPADPSFYVNVPSRIDPTAAPEGCDSLVILVPIGHLRTSRVGGGSSISAGVEPARANSGEGLDLNSSADLQEIIKQTRSKVLATIKDRTGADIEGLIKHEIINDPVTWEDKFNLDKGSILGLSHSFFNVLAFRPSISHTESSGPVKLLPGIGARKGIEGVYFVGASTHPGTGVPIVLAGAKMTTERVLGDLSMRVPWSRKEWEVKVGDKGVGGSGGGASQRSAGIDRLGGPQLFSTERFLQIFIVMIALLLWRLVV